MAAGSISSLASGLRIEGLSVVEEKNLILYYGFEIEEYSPAARISDQVGAKPTI